VENQDYPTLFNNFIYVFGFVDYQMRCSFVTKPNDMGVMEKLIRANSSDSYSVGISFQFKNTFSLLQLSGYHDYLLSIGIRTEEMIEWFFEKYIGEEFEISDFLVNMPSLNSTNLEKCASIMPALESVLKQFKLYVENGQIDFELLGIGTAQIVYKSIPSLVQKKYAYGAGDEFDTLAYLFFSDQTLLSLSRSSKQSYRNFFTLLQNENVKITEYDHEDVDSINYLIEKNYLTTDSEENIKFKDESLIQIIKDLYYNEVINYWSYPKRFRTLIDSLQKVGVLKFENTLFSKPESDFFDFVLNRSRYNNGLDLRNKYSHTQPGVGQSEAMHRENYMRFLKLFIITVIKINDDLCAYDKSKEVI
jgi:hypothetical protein